MSEVVHVAVAVLVNESDDVCISLRHDDSHQGGLWEFPGGKIEAGESAEQALKREIEEELGLMIVQSRPLISIRHDYTDKQVCLHVSKVSRFAGEIADKATGPEGQRVRWVSVSELRSFDFPAANLAIIKALQLPDKYLITGKFVDEQAFSKKLNAALNQGIRLVQLRLKDDSLTADDQLPIILEHAASLCQQFDAKLMLNLSEKFIDQFDLSLLAYDGIHADSKTLRSLVQDNSLPAQQGKWFSASCHNQQELLMAQQLQADFVVLSPVQQTASHPDIEPLGWQSFSSLIEKISMPVYALGGVAAGDLETAWAHGAQGVSAISAFWEK